MFYRAIEDGRLFLLICFDIFGFSYLTTESNLTKLDRKQILTSSTKLNFFWAIKKSRQQLLPLAETSLTSTLQVLKSIWQTFTKSKNTTFFYQVCVFFDFKTNQSVKLVFKLVCVAPSNRKTDCHHSIWLTETFLTFPLQPLNRIWLNLKSSNSEIDTLNWISIWTLSSFLLQ